MRSTLSILLLAAAVASATTVPPQEHARLFQSWKALFGKSYATPEEEAHRLSVFAGNVEKIAAHNAQHLSWTMGLNHFADLTADEFGARFVGGLLPHARRQNPVALEHLRRPRASLPASVDWEAAGKVTPVKNQQQCGSCWAFSTTGSVESAWAIAKGELVSLSEQQLVDCSTSGGNEGCNGGYVDVAFKYVIANKGLCTEKEYPYTAADGTCKKCTPAVTISSYVDVPVDNEDAMLSALAQQPLSVGIEADQNSFQFYSGGVMTEKCGVRLDHAVLAVGYGTLNGQDYYKVKNSWGKSWGENGYILLGRGATYNKGKGQCGVQMEPEYPVV